MSQTVGRGFSAGVSDRESADCSKFFDCLQAASQVETRAAFECHCVFQVSRCACHIASGKCQCCLASFEFRAARATLDVQIRQFAVQVDGRCWRQARSGAVLPLALIGSSAPEATGA